MTFSTGKVGMFVSKTLLRPSTASSQALWVIAFPSVTCIRDERPRNGLKNSLGPRDSKDPRDKASKGLLGKLLFCHNREAYLA